MSACKQCGKVPSWFSDWDDCNNCGGTGKDEYEVDGECIYCIGYGEIDRGEFVCDCDPYEADA